MDFNRDTVVSNRVLEPAKEAPAPITPEKPASQTTILPSKTPKFNPDDEETPHKPEVGEDSFEVHCSPVKGKAAVPRTTLNDLPKMRMVISSRAFGLIMLTVSRRNPRRVLSRGQRLPPGSPLFPRPLPHPKPLRFPKLEFRALAGSRA